MGVMLNAAGSLALVPRRARAGRAFDELTAEAAAWPPGRGGRYLPRRTSRASARRTPIRTHAAPSPGLSLRHDRGALVRAVLEGVAYGLRDSLELLRELGVAARARARLRRRRAQPALARDRRVGARPAARATARSTRARRTAPRSSRASRAARSRRRTRRSRAASACASRSSRTLRGRRATTMVTLAFARSIRPSDEWRRSMGLEGKVAFVTGASRGIGAAVARSLSSEGVSVGLASRSGDDLGLDRCARRSRATSATLRQVEDAVARTVERFGRLDICVANAGVGSYHTLVDTPVEHLEEMIDVNLKGTIYAARASLPHLIAAERRRRHARLRGRATRASGRGGVLRVEVRPGRPHARARPRAARARRSAARTSARAGSRPTSRSRRDTAARPTSSRG